MLVRLDLVLLLSCRIEWFYSDPLHTDMKLQKSTPTTPSVSLPVMPQMNPSTSVLLCRTCQARFGKRGPQNGWQHLHQSSLEVQRTWTTSTPLEIIILFWFGLSPQTTNFSINHQSAHRRHRHAQCGQTQDSFNESWASLQATLPCLYQDCAAYL